MRQAGKELGDVIRQAGSYISYKHFARGTCGFADAGSMTVEIPVIERCEQGFHR
jgi:hypothetical protein